MNVISFNEKDLPISELGTIGLASGGQLLLNVNDLKTLLSGRRTALLQLKDLEAEGIQIKAMDAKISLKLNAQGKADLLIHPIYRKPATPAYLDDNEARQLKKGQVQHFLKSSTDDKGNKQELLVEYDEETREFIVSDTEKILVPDMVNSEFLTAAQKENYRKGRQVELADKTVFNYSGTDINGIRSNRLALVASVLIDGGLTYVLYKGLNAAFGQIRDPDKANSLSPGYYNALEDMRAQRTASDNGQIRFEGHSRAGR